MRRSAAPVSTEMRNVDLQVDDTIVMRIGHLRGDLLPTRSSEPPTFDDKSSFILRIASAEIGMTAGHFGELMNRYVLSYEGCPIQDLVVTVEEGKLKQKGILDKGIHVPFSLKGAIEATPDGDVRLLTSGFKAAGIPAKGLLDLFDVELDEMIALDPRRGVRVEENSLVLDPELVLPPPRIRGRVMSVSLEGDRIVLVFGGAAPARRLIATRSPNYMYYRGGILRFGKLTMTDTDLQLIDADPRDPFHFSQARYNEHLTAGYSKNTPAKGLRVFMPDLEDLAGTRRRGGLRPS